MRQRSYRGKQPRSSCPGHLHGGARAHGTMGFADVLESIRNKSKRTRRNRPARNRRRCESLQSNRHDSFNRSPPEPRAAPTFGREYRYVFLHENTEQAIDPTLELQPGHAFDQHKTRGVILHNAPRPSARTDTALNASPISLRLV